MTDYTLIASHGIAVLSGATMILIPAVATVLKMHGTISDLRDALEASAPLQRDQAMAKLQRHIELNQAKVEKQPLRDSKGKFARASEMA